MSNEQNRMPIPQIDVDKALRNITMPQVGKKTKVRIAKIEPNVLGNIIPPEKMQQGSKPTTQVIVLLTQESERIGFLSLPNKGRLYPSSNMYKFIKRYGGPPKVGMEVELEEDEKGFKALVM